MTRFHPAVIVTINRSTDGTSPQEILDFHVDHGAWWSSRRRDHRLADGQLAFARNAGTNELVARARILDRVASLDPVDDELIWRYEVEFLDTVAIRGVHLRDFGLTGGRARPGFISLSSSETALISAALDGAAARAAQPA
jgi:hypothetical protein